jgi:hypothetical protein
MLTWIQRNVPREMSATAMPAASPRAGEKPVPVLR